jgi:glutamate synthase (NADPH/NADH) large chain
MGERPLTDYPGLYHPRFEHDACGVGFIAHIKGTASHTIVQQGLKILHQLDHRGATGADSLVGDGSGILLQLPDALFRQDFAARGIPLPPLGEYGVGMVFLPQEPASREACEYEIERAIKDEGQLVLGWRDVPTNNSVISPSVKHLEPVVRQVFIGRGPSITVPDALERKLYIIRKSSGHAIQALRLAHGKEFYVPSMSTRTIVYKGMLLPNQLGTYYLDLHDERLVSAMALVHQRFSTNTFPTWDLAHPFRLIAHNGEINTLRGNVNWLRARQGAIHSRILGDDLNKIWPLIYDGQSDSASFDNALELLVMAGYPVAHAMMMMIPEAWEKHELMDKRRRAFYEYHAALMEPWDGPAAIVFTDGKQIGATLDRNGLRPARYIVTDDDYVIMGSECGCLQIPEEKIIKKWRLQPGKMFLVDLEAGYIIDDGELKDQLARAKPYQAWVKAIRIELDQLPAVVSQRDPIRETLLDRQQAFGYTDEDLKFILLPMASKGEEPIGSMGNDSPLAPLSKRNKSLYSYFTQNFAQVTNPPIDPIREELVMSLVSFIGPKPNLLGVDETNPPPCLEVSQPILSVEQMDKLRAFTKENHGKFKAVELDITYEASWGYEAIEARLASLCAMAEDAVRARTHILILSDRTTDRHRFPIPALLALSAIHQHLTNRGLRTSTSLIVETGSAREVHHIALLASYGAEAIHPYLALETVATLADAQPQLLKDATTACKNLIKAYGKGLMKVMSKMGISTYMSYTGAQIFEAVGLKKSLVDKYFTGTASTIEGIDLFALSDEAHRTHRAAFGTDPLLENSLATGGEYEYRLRGEEHLWTPEAVTKLQQATRTNSFATYEEYAKLINEQNERHLTLRGLFAFKPQQPVPLEEVEPAKDIVKRFATGAMSLGSISTEAHTTLALAMNRIGGKSNTGEGGEDRRRYDPIVEGETLASRLGEHRIERDLPLLPGDSLNSKIKQVASGRFGVTAEYLAMAEQIQIKVAQGAKPGEGGQLPGKKVSEYIAELRYATPGVELISPPPHHDIYSIEDLAQLVHDLKSVNPQASISVKLVSEIGVGTVAAGVSKCKADHVTIAGHDGGTGASPWGSIKHAGTPWEIGLAETQQTLVLNRLRGRIRVQVDGQLRTGRDVVIGAILGADEFGFATAPLVVTGCIMMRKCHLNTCPVGVATQDPQLRKLFKGQPEHVINYFFFVAEEARQLMAQLGVRTIDELIGHTELLEMRQGIEHWKARGLDYSRIFYSQPMPSSVARYHQEQQDHGLEHSADQQLIQQARPALETLTKTVINTSIKNTYRSYGAMLSGVIAKRYGHTGLPDETLQVQLTGAAGQSFGAFLARGVWLDLVGETNDYCGKGLSGGRISVQPSPRFRGESTENMITGNVALYGAISGEAYFRGVAGERFAVRNSGATAVVEGVGDHGCEYMTGGLVIVLGNTGRNFAAGMSGGIALVYDRDGTFAEHCNSTMVTLEPVLTTAEQHAANTPWLHYQQQTDEELLLEYIQRHINYTGSAWAKELLNHWEEHRGHFVKVFPKEYQRALRDQHQSSGAIKPESMMLTGAVAMESHRREVRTAYPA